MPSHPHKHFSTMQPPPQQRAHHCRPGHGGLTASPARASPIENPFAGIAAISRGAWVLQNRLSWQEKPWFGFPPDQPCLPTCQGAAVPAQSGLGCPTRAVPRACPGQGQCLGQRLSRASSAPPRCKEDLGSPHSVPRGSDLPLPPGRVPQLCRSCLSTPADFTAPHTRPIVFRCADKDAALRTTQLGAHARSQIGRRNSQHLDQPCQHPPGAGCPRVPSLLAPSRLPWMLGFNAHLVLCWSPFYLLPDLMAQKPSA